MNLPPPIERLIGELAKFPGVGKRSAERMALDLVTATTDRIGSLAAALVHVQESIALCPRCGYFADGEGRCFSCDEDREEGLLLVVERPLDVVAFEKAGGFRGRYHVLGGHLSPLKGITPQQLRLSALFERTADRTLTEMIVATSASVEGDATALYIARHAERDGLAITRLGRGVPMGGSLEFSDSGTLRMALEGRRSLGGP